MVAFSTLNALPPTAPNTGLPKNAAGALIDAAEEELAAAGALHAELERIYGKATDYSVVSEMSERVIAAVLRR